jgi:hypothetical protein
MVGEEEEVGIEMEGIGESDWDILQQDLSFKCSFEDVAVDDVLPCDLMCFDTLCDESPKVEDTIEVNEESALVHLRQ